MIEAPHRACILTAKIEADTREEMVSALVHMAQQLERGELSNGCSGGPGAGTIYDYVENGEPSHDEYFIRLRAYLAESRAIESRNGVGVVKP